MPGGAEGRGRWARKAKRGAEEREGRGKDQGEEERQERKEVGDKREEKPLDKEAKDLAIRSTRSLPPAPE